MHLKPKVMKLTYTKKNSFFIIGTTIYFAFAIPLNHFLMNSKIKWWKNDMLRRTYDQLQLVVINEISLVGNKILTFIDYKLEVI
jgi:hypothetical protein